MLKVLCLLVFAISLAGCPDNPPVPDDSQPPKEGF